MADSWIIVASTVSQLLRGGCFPVKSSPVIHVLVMDDALESMCVGTTLEYIVSLSYRVEPFPEAASPLNFFIY